MGTVQTDHGLGYNLDRGDLVGSQLHSSNLASLLSPCLKQCLQCLKSFASVRGYEGSAGMRGGVGGLGGGSIRLPEVQAALEDHAGQHQAGVLPGQELPADRRLSQVTVPSRTQEGHNHHGPPRDFCVEAFPMT